MYSSFTLTLPDPPAVVRGRLAAALTTDRPSLFHSAISLGGEVSDAGFTVSRNRAWTERPFPAVAEGRFEPTATGTVVHIHTWPPLLQTIVMFVVAPAVAGLILWTSPGPRVDLGVFLGLCLLFLWGGTFVFALVEEHNLRQALTAVLSSPPPTGTTSPPTAR